MAALTIAGGIAARPRDRVRFTAGFFARRFGTIVDVKSAGLDPKGNMHPPYLVLQVDGCADRIVSLGYKLELLDELEETA